MTKVQVLTLFLLISFSSSSQAHDFCIDTPEYINGVDLNRPGNTYNYEIDCPLRRLALFKLSQSQSSESEIRRSLEVLKEQGYFSKEAAEKTLPLVEQITLNEDLRVFAARVFYLLFYEAAEIELQRSINIFLQRKDIQNRLSKIINSDPHPQVRTYIIEIFQVYMSPYRVIDRPALKLELPPWQRLDIERVASIYIPILLKTLVRDFSEATFNDRNEVLVAIENLSATATMRKESHLRPLRKWYHSETDPFLKERLDDHPYIGPYIKTGKRP